MRRIVLLLALNLLAGLPTARAAWYEREEAIMGTRIAVQLWCDDSVLAVNAIGAVMANMHRTDALMSSVTLARKRNRDGRVLGRTTTRQVRHLKIGSDHEWSSLIRVEILPLTPLRLRSLRFGGGFDRCRKALFFVRETGRTKVTSQYYTLSGTTYGFR